MSNQEKSRESRKAANKGEGKKKPVKLIIILVILAVIVGYIASCTIKARNAIMSFVDSGSKETVETRDLKNTVSATGKVVSMESRTYSSSVVNVDVTQLNVKIGDYVQAGDVIAVLDNSNLQASLNDANTSRNASSGISSINVGAANRNLANSKEVQNVNQARANQRIDDAISDLNEANGELADAKKELDDANAAWSNAKSVLENSRAALEIANAQYAQALSESGINTNQEAMTNALNEFNAEKAALVADISAIAEMEKAYLSTSVIDGLAIDNMSSLTTTLVYSGSDAGVRSIIDGHIARLQAAAVKYEQAKYSNDNNEKLVAAQQNLSAAQAALATAETNYSSASTRKQTAESAYKATNKAADSAYDMVTTARQNKEDITRSDNMSVASNADSVKSAGLNASTATLSVDSEIRRIEEQIDDCNIVSSVSGVVTAIGVKEGDKYTGGAIAVIEDVASYRIETQVDEYDISKIQVGQKVTIKATGSGAEILDGVVSEVAPRSTVSESKVGTANAAVTYRVLIDVLTKNDNLRLDMTAKLNIITDEVQGVLSLSHDAIQTDDEGNTYVDVLDGEYITLQESMEDPELAQKRAKQQDPETHKVYVNKGMESDFYVEVISEELKEGDIIFIKGSGDYSDLEAYLQETGSAGGM